MTGTWPDDDMSGKLEQKVTEALSVLKIFGIEPTPVRALFLCRRCKATTEMQALLSKPPTGEEDYSYIDYSFFHKCSHGKYGVMELLGFDDE